MLIEMQYFLFFLYGIYLYNTSLEILVLNVITCRTDYVWVFKTRK